MKENGTALFSSLVLADAFARKPRRNSKKAKKSTNNYLAKAPRRPGAPKGNRNALRHGKRSAAWIAWRRELRIQLRELRELLGCTRDLRVERELEALLQEAISAASARLVRGPP